MPTLSKGDQIKRIIRKRNAHFPPHIIRAYSVVFVPYAKISWLGQHGDVCGYCPERIEYNIWRSKHMLDNAPVIVNYDRGTERVSLTGTDRRPVLTDQYS